jgi:hypothetical protein
MSVTSIPILVHAATSLNLSEVETWLRAERDADGRPLEARLVAPIQAQLETITAACERGPFPFRPNFQAAVVTCDLEELRSAILTGNINCLVVEVYPDAEWLLAHPEAAGLNVIEFTSRNLSPVIGSDCSGDMEAYFRPFRTAGSEYTLTDRFRQAFDSAGILEPERLSADQFLEIQADVFRSLPPQPSVRDRAGHVSIRFSSIYSTLTVPARANQQYGLLSLPHVLTSSPTYNFLTPVEWLFVSALAYQLKIQTFSYGIPLDAITASTMLKGTITRYSAGVGEGAADYAAGGGALRHVV